MNFGLYFSEVMEGDLSGSANQVKKSIGSIVVSANTDILALLKGFKKVKDGGTLNKSEAQVEKSLLEKKEGLKNAIRNLESRKDFIKEGNLEKSLKLM